MEILRDFVLVPAVKMAVLIFVGVLPLITYLVLAERKVLGYMQARLGPNRVGPWGLLQPIADVMKLLVKEDVLPAQAVRVGLHPGALPGSQAGVHHLRRVSAVGPPGGGPRAHRSLHHRRVNVGLLFIIALATIGVYGRSSAAGRRIRSTRCSAACARRRR
jgi:NADH-quinone oxidoreductase subunit H